MHDGKPFSYSLTLLEMVFVLSVFACVIDTLNKPRPWYKQNTNLFLSLSLKNLISNFPGARKELGVGLLQKWGAMVTLNHK